ATAQPRTVDIHVHYFVEVVWTHFINRTPDVDTGAVDEDIDLAEGFNSSFYHGLSITLDSNICRERVGANSVFGSQPLSGDLAVFRCTIYKHNISASRCQALGHRQSKSLRSASDNRGFAGEVELFNSRKHRD